MSSSVVELPPLGYRAHFITMAHNICQSVEYCMQRFHVGAETFVCSSTAEYVIEILKHYPEYGGEVV